MGLYEEWFKIAYTKDGQTNKKLWDEYVPKEQKIYEYILENKVESMDTTVKELSEKFDMSTQFIAGFIDGINDTQENKVDMESLTEDSKISLKIDFEVLYKKMVEYKADNLYNLPQWKNIFSENQLKVFYKNQKNSKTYVREEKIGRNDPCPCGSGKKYKKCCGMN
ncbi:MAG: SEC-C domain-containing protein [Firmicutes bacterium]|nr:SEC-C domain-containing protein [Bacillota bacterium]